MAFRCLVSVSRKSFIRALAGVAVTASGPATLAAELFAARHGADMIRTHDPAALWTGDGGVVRFGLSLTSTHLTHCTQSMV